MWPFPSKAKSQPLRFVAATKRENLAAQRRRNDKRLELAVYVVTTTPEQRKAETEQFFARARETEADRFKRLEHEIFKGMR
jgi:BarA-like signal transduction histidine kinase